MASFEVMLSGAAAGELDALGPRRSGMLAMALGTRALAYGQLEPSAIGGGLVSVRTRLDAALCVVIAGRRTLLVYAVRSHRSLERDLFGRDLQDRFHRHVVQRMLHGRH